jgi:hypothetical protein
MPYIKGPRKWSCTRDEEGHREYKITHLVIAESTAYGPAIILYTPGLPIPGSIWAFGYDFDLWAYCKRDADVNPVITGEPGIWWEVTHTFTTKPASDKAPGNSGDGGGGCVDNDQQDPLLVPQRISGSFTKFTKEAVFARQLTIVRGDGSQSFQGLQQRIRSSSYEQIRGPQVEFDDSRPQVRIEQNVPLLQLDLLNSLKDHVNEAPLWGLPARTIKLSNTPWERKFKGHCELYYTRTLEFDINVLLNDDGTITSGWDRELLDEGTKVLNGRWEVSGEQFGWHLTGIGGPTVDPDYTDPSHYTRFKGRDGNPTRCPLDSRLGTPLGANVYHADGSLYVTGDDEPSKVLVQYYPPADFLQLGIPLFF